LVDDGLTLIEYGELVIPVTLCELPSNHVRSQGCVPVRATFRFVEAPLHIVAEPLITLVGLEFTVTVAVPVMSPPDAVQLSSLSAVMVYVAVDDGLTLIEYGELVIPVTLCELPSNHVRSHGWVPVRATLRFVEAPLHIVAEPLITLVGLEFTVTVAEPVMSPPDAVQLSSLSAVMV
jgi:hypothetical protein